MEPVPMARSAYHQDIGVYCVADPRQAEEHAMKKAVDRYVLSFESESVRNKQKRHHWMICLAKRPDELVSWGHAPTHERAESKARNELQDLLSGLTQGGHVSQQHHAVPPARS
jgi:hypothetical protein